MNNENNTKQLIIKKLLPKISMESIKGQPSKNHSSQKKPVGKKLQPTYNNISNKLREELVSRIINNNEKIARVIIPHSLQCSFFI